MLKILTGVYTDYDGEFSVTHGVTLGYLEQNAKLDVTLDIYGEMRSSFAPVLDAMAQMQILEKKMAASPDDAALLEKHDELQNIIDAADGYNMDVNIKKVLSGMGFAQDTWSKKVRKRNRPVLIPEIVSAHHGVRLFDLGPLTLEKLLRKLIEGIIRVTGSPSYPVSACVSCGLYKRPVAYRRGGGEDPQDDR